MSNQQCQRFSPRGPQRTLSHFTEFVFEKSPIGLGKRDYFEVA